MIKSGTLLLWLAALGTFVLSYPSPWDTVALWTVILLVVAHTVECIVYAKRVALADGNKVLHFVQLFLFGVIHANTLPAVE